LRILNYILYQQDKLPIKIQSKNLTCGAFCFIGSACGVFSSFVIEKSCGVFCFIIFFVSGVFQFSVLLGPLFLASTVSTMHNAQKCTHLKRLQPLGSHLLLLSHCVLTQHEGQKKSHASDAWNQTTPVMGHMLLTTLLTLHLKLKGTLFSVVKF